MPERPVQRKFSELDCCPELELKPVCDILRLRYRLPFRPRLGEKGQQVVPVEVVIHLELKRCSGPLVIGDPVYSTTLLPGEKVRLFTSDRHTRWSYDSESNLSYRHETTSVESFYAAGMAEAMSNLTINESGFSASSYQDSWAEGGGGASISILGLIDIGGGGGGGSYDAQSMNAFSHSLSRHTESASRYVATSVRAKSAVSVGEVERRSHAVGESEAHYESSSRLFSNPNKCHAVTYLFRQLNKLQHVSMKLVAIERRVLDPAAPTGAYQRIPRDTTGRLNVLPQSIPATKKDRLSIEQAARASALERQQVAASNVGMTSLQMPYNVALSTATILNTQEPLDKTLRDQALKAVDEELVKGDILDQKTLEPTERIIGILSWEMTEVIPTAGILVKGCLDKCNTCEPALEKEIALDLERKQLENVMLKKQIDLLEKSQEYRCCPGETSEKEEETDE